MLDLKVPTLDQSSTYVATPVVPIEPVERYSKEFLEAAAKAGMAPEEYEKFLIASQNSRTTLSQGDTRKKSSTEKTIEQQAAKKRVAEQTKRETEAAQAEQAAKEVGQFSAFLSPSTFVNMGLQSAGKDPLSDGAATAVDIGTDLGLGLVTGGAYALGKGALRTGAKTTSKLALKPVTKEELAAIASKGITGSEDLITRGKKFLKKTFDNTPTKYDNEFRQYMLSGDLSYLKNTPVYNSEIVKHYDIPEDVLKDLNRYSAIRMRDPERALPAFYLETPDGAMWEEVPDIMFKGTDSDGALAQIWPSSLRIQVRPGLSNSKNFDNKNWLYSKWTDLEHELRHKLDFTNAISTHDKDIDYNALYQAYSKIPDPRERVTSNYDLRRALINKYASKYYSPSDIHLDDVYWQNELLDKITEDEIFETMMQHGYLHEAFSATPKAQIPYANIRHAMKFVPAAGAVVGTGAAGLNQQQTQDPTMRRWGGTCNYLDYFKSGSKINIKKSHKGLFTSYCKGKVTEDCIRKGKASKDPAIRKRAVFAENARKFKH